MRILDWTALDETARRLALRRPAMQVNDSIGQRVREIVERVRAEGDAALISLAAELDRAQLESLRVDADEVQAAQAELSAEAKQAIATAIDNVTRFHAAQQARTHPRGDRAGRDLRAHQQAAARRRPVRPGRHRTAALDSHHARRACGHRRLSGARHVHAAASGWTRRSGRGDSSHGPAASAPSTRPAAHRPSPRWPMAPRRFPRC